MNTAVTLAELQNIFVELYESTKTNIETLQQEVKKMDDAFKNASWEEQEDMDLAPNFVREFINKQADLMNKIHNDFDLLVSMYSQKK